MIACALGAIRRTAITLSNWHAINSIPNEDGRSIGLPKGSVGFIGACATLGATHARVPLVHAALEAHDHAHLLRLDTCNPKTADL